MHQYFGENDFAVGTRVRRYAYEESEYETEMLEQAIKAVVRNFSN